MRKKRLGTALVTVTKRMPSSSRVERTEALAQVVVAVRLSARCNVKPLVLGQDSSTKLVPGTVRMAMSGRASTVKLLLLVTLPCGVSIVIGPVLALSGTVAVNCRSVKAALVLKENAAGVPLNSTRVAPVKFVPLSVTFWLWYAV